MIKTYTKGKRNLALTGLASTLCHAKYDLEKVKDMLRVENESYCLPPLESNLVNRIAEIVFRYTPARS